MIGARLLRKASVCQRQFSGPVSSPTSRFFATFFRYCHEPIAHRQLPSTRTNRDERSSLRLRPYSSSATQESTAQKLRHTLRHVPTSIAIITTADHTTPAKQAGMTVSSLTSVSLSPEPILSFNIKLPSTTYNALQSSKTFLVHLLSSSKESAALADSFTRPGGLEKMNSSVAVTEVKIGQQRLPRLGSNAVRAVLACQLLDEQLRVGDHVIVLGKVLSVDTTGKSENGLVYMDGQYRKIGDSFLTHEEVPVS